MIERVPWSADAEKNLARAAGSKSAVDSYRDEVNNGKASLWVCSGDLAGYLVTRLELDGEDRELVAVAFEGSGYVKLGDYLRGIAALLDCQRIRGHIRADNPALLRLAKRGGFEADEIIIRCKSGF